MQNYNIKTDNTYKELIEHGSTSFPIAGYDEYFSMFTTKEVPWHWHEELELVVVVQGSFKLEILGNTEYLKEGEGLFINKNILHRMTKTSEEDCHILNFVLHTDFLSNSVSDIIKRKYFIPLTENKSVPFIKFKSTSNWEKTVTSTIINCIDVYRKKELGYEMYLKSNIIEIFRLMIINNQSLLETHENETKYTNRLDRMIKHIHKTYQDELSVKDIASSVNVSESECYRLFNTLLNTTPTEYLNSHRLQQAATLLTTTDKYITEIMNEVGYNNHSYFTKRFKKQFGSTPKEYKSQNKK